MVIRFNPEFERFANNKLQNRTCYFINLYLTLIVVFNYLINVFDFDKPNTECQNKT